MKTVEAIVALLVFLLILQLFNPTVRPVDSSLYQIQLANDIWRVFQLRGDLQGFNKLKLNADANEVTKLTSLCIEFDEEDVTSCIPKSNIAQISRMVIIDDQPKKITVKVGTEK